IGAAWIDGAQLAAYMTARGIPGVRFRALEFTPTSSNFAGKKIPGIAIELTDRDAFSATKLGIELALALGKLYPGKIDWAASRRLIGSNEVVSALTETNPDALSFADAG